MGRPALAGRFFFTLSGWAKGYGLPDHEREDCPSPTFRLRAKFYFIDGTTDDTNVAEFSPCTEEWQFASVQFAKDAAKKVAGLVVLAEYGYNFGTVYFDDLQLIRDSVEYDLADTDFTGAVDADDENVTDTVDETEEADTTTATDTAPTFTEATDKYGNTLTETTFTDGEFGTIYRSFGFSSACNGA